MNDKLTSNNIELPDRTDLIKTIEDEITLIKEIKKGPTWPIFLAIGACVTSHLSGISDETDWERWRQLTLASLWCGNFVWFIYLLFPIAKFPVLHLAYPNQPLFGPISYLSSIGLQTFYLYLVFSADIAPCSITRVLSLICLGAMVFLLFYQLVKCLKKNVRYTHGTASHKVNYYLLGTIVVFYIVNGCFAFLNVLQHPITVAEIKNFLPLGLIVILISNLLVWHDRPMPERQLRQLVAKIRMRQLSVEEGMDKFFDICG